MDSASKSDMPYWLALGLGKLYNRQSQWQIMDYPIQLIVATNRSLIAVQAAVSRKDIAVMTSTRKYESPIQ